MRSRTVRQPWAWLIWSGLKDIENCPVMPPADVAVPGVRHVLHVSKWWNRSQVLQQLMLVEDLVGGAGLNVTAVLDEMEAQLGQCIATFGVAGVIDDRRDPQTQDGLSLAEWDRAAASPWLIPGKVAVVLCGVRRLVVRHPLRGNEGWQPVRPELAAALADGHEGVAVMP